MKHRAVRSGASGRPSNASVVECVVVEHGGPGVLVVRLSGILDGRTGTALERQVLQSIDPAEGAPHVLLNLAAVGYLDRAGLDSMLRLQREIALLDGVLDLLAPSPAVIQMVHEADHDGFSWLSPPAAQQEP